jgi:hypothetical protein
VWTTRSIDNGYSHLTEVEAWSESSATNLHWLVTDQLGTPRMIVDQNGSLANVARHDYLPFGEELFAGTGDARTNRQQLRKDSLKTQKDKGGPAEKPHNERPEEKRANAFKNQVERERKAYKKQQKAERKRQKREKKRQQPQET